MESKIKKALMAILKEEAGQIQIVGAQIGVTKAAPQKSLTTRKLWRRKREGRF
jgi:hypothetical protein